MTDAPKGFTRDTDGVLVWGGGSFRTYYRDPGEAIRLSYGNEPRDRCSAAVWRERSNGPCNSRPKFDPDANGRPTKCGVHSKAKDEAKKEQRNRENEERRARWAREDRIREARAAVEPALRRIAEGHNDPRTLAREVLDELDQARGPQKD